MDEAKFDKLIHDGFNGLVEGFLRGVMMLIQPFINYLMETRLLPRILWLVIVFVGLLLGIRMSGKLRKKIWYIINGILAILAILALIY